jgi:uncharacterized repeat protein (TIGR01451 family)
MSSPELGEILTVWSDKQTEQSAALVIASEPIFQDVFPTHWAYDYIEAIFNAGLTHGYPDGTFRPDNPVARAEIAVFLERGMRGSGFSPPPASGIVFDDVPEGHWGAAWIEQLVTDGITGGCSTNPPLYCPGGMVTRAQMAIFLERAMHWPAAYTPPPASGTVFNDVPIDHWAAAWIEQLASDGITGGCSASPPLYCPDNPVTRAQMAVFLVRAFNIPVGPTPTPTSTPTPTNTPTPTATFTPTPTPEADLGITKSDSPDPIQAGWDLTYVIEVTNDGPDDATGVVVTDNPPADVSYQSHVASQGVFNPGPPAEWNVGDLSVGSSATLTIVVQVSASAPSGTINNEAMVTSDVFDPDGTDNTAEANTLVISTNQIQSDDFTGGSLNTDLWTYVDPLGDASISMTGTNVEIEVAAGFPEHDLWTGTENTVPRLMQNASDQNFEIEVKLDSMPIGAYAAHGLLVEQDPDDFLQYYIYSYESALLLYAAKVTAGVVTPLTDTLISGDISGVPMYLRLTRDGDDWYQWYSDDGLTWLGGYSFNHPLTVTSVGLFVGNESDHPADPPGFTGSFDYFFNTAAPIDPQD